MLENGDTLHFDGGAVQLDSSRPQVTEAIGVGVLLSYTGCLFDDPLGSSILIFTGEYHLPNPQSTLRVSAGMTVTDVAGPCFGTSTDSASVRIDGPADGTWTLLLQIGHWELCTGRDGCPSSISTSAAFVAGLTSGTGATATINSVDSTFQSPCPGDVDHDHDADLNDLALSLGVFGTSAGDPGLNLRADFDARGTVDLADLSVLLSNFGATCN